MRLHLGRINTKIVGKCFQCMTRQHCADECILLYIYENSISMHISYMESKNPRDGQVMFIMQASRMSRKES